MRNQKKIVMVAILCISILFCLLTGYAYAIDETTEDNNTTQTPSPEEPGIQEEPSTPEPGTEEPNIPEPSPEEPGTQEEPSTPKTITQKPSTPSNNKPTTTKSPNADLSNLGITPNDFKGFTPGTTTYEVTVPENTETVDVYAKTQHAKATVTGTGKKNLEKGENKVEVIVTAEDGTKKTYTINIIREIQQEEDKETNNEENNIGNEGKGLAELKISNINLSPEFKTDVYEYTVKYIGKDTKLNIETKPTSENYMVEVVGNENIQEGENIITILVSEENGDNVATYQITVNKSLVDLEAIAREEAEKREQKQKIMIGATIIVVILAIVVFIIIRHRRNKYLAKEFSGDYYYDRDNEDEEEYDDDYEEELEEDKIEKMPKEKLKEEFLNNYNSNYEEEYQEESDSKRKVKHRGKRFK